MELQEAKEVFQFENNFTQKDIDAFYDFEKNTLLDKLSSDGSDEELMETQTALAKLERAYSVLSIKIGSNLDEPDIETTSEEIIITSNYGKIPTTATTKLSTFQNTLPKEDISDEDDLAESLEKNNANNIRNYTLLLFLLLVITAGVGYVSFYGTPEAIHPKTVVSPVPEPKEVTQPASSRSDKKSTLVGENKLDTINLLVNRINKLEVDWKPYIKKGYILPNLITNHIEKAKLLHSHRRLSQTIYHYDEAEFFFTKHIKAIQEYESNHQEVLGLEQNWTTLASEEKYTYPNAIKHSQKLEGFSKMYREGLKNESIIGAIQAISFEYKKAINLGNKIKMQHKEYLSLKQKWEKLFLNAENYTLTPSVQLLINKARRPVSTSEFEYLNTQVYPRLIKHFEENLYN